MLLKALEKLKNTASMKGRLLKKELVKTRFKRQKLFKKNHVKKKKLNC